MSASRRTSTGVFRSIERERSPIRRKYRITRLVFVERFETAPDAIAREKQLKGWRRSKKIFLINQADPEWRDLSGEIDA